MTVFEHAVSSRPGSDTPRAPIGGLRSRFQRTGRAILESPWSELSLLLAAVAALNAPALDAYFHGDDFVALVDVVNRPAGAQLWDSLTFGDGNFYWRPLGNLYHKLMYEVVGLEAVWYRAANLLVFLISLVAVHRLGLRFGLGRAGAFVAVLVFGVYSNHVVSVAWITNHTRLLAMLFFLVSLLALHSAIARRSLGLEALAWLSFVTACLFDEVAVALAPLLAGMSLLLYGHAETYTRQLARLWAYAAVAAVLIPPQFLFSLDDEPRLASYHFTPDVFEQGWALTAQLVLPLGSPTPMDVPFAEMPDAQWAAGAVAIAAGAVLLIVGSRLVRFLVIWTALGLAAFAPWDTDVVAPRYVYLAAAPFAMLAAHLAWSLVTHLHIAPRLIVAPALSAALAGALAFGALTTLERNQAFERDIHRYEVLGDGLPDVVEDPRTGARIVIYNGIWTRWPVWPQSVLRAVYADPTITVHNVTPERIGSFPTLPGDVIVYYRDGRFLERNPSVSGR